MPFCESCLKEFKAIENKPIMDIIVDVCDYYDIYYTEVISKKRNSNLIMIRYKLYDLIYSNFNNKITLKQIGSYFGNKDHSTIINGIKNVKTFCQIYPEFREEYKKLHLKIYGSLRYFKH